MVSKNYLLHKAQGPSAPKRFFDQEIVPAIANLLGSGEGALLSASRRIERQPGQALLFAFFAGALVSLVCALRD